MENLPPRKLENVLTALVRWEWIQSASIHASKEQAIRDIGFRPTKT